MIGSQKKCQLADMPWLRAEENTVYQSRIAQFLASYDLTRGLPNLDIWVGNFSSPYDGFWYVKAGWSRDIAREIPFCAALLLLGDSRAFGEDVPCL